MLKHIKPFFITKSILTLTIFLLAAAPLRAEVLNNRWGVGSGVPYGFVGFSGDQRIYDNLFLCASIGNPNFLSQTSAKSFGLRYYFRLSEFHKNYFRVSWHRGDVAIYESKNFEDYDLAQGDGLFFGFIWEIGDHHHCEIDLGHTTYRDLPDHVDLSKRSFNFAIGYGRSFDLF